MSPIPTVSSETATLRADRPIRVACLGGGQLGRMMALEAPRLNIEMFFLDDTGPACSAASVVASHQIIQGSIQDADAIHQFIQDVQPDFVTTEIEHVNCAALRELEGQPHNVVVVRPCSAVIQLIQDKYLQKVHFQSVTSTKIPVPPFLPCSTMTDIRLAIDTLGLPLMIKARTGAYDGRGNAVLKDQDDASIRSVLDKLGVNEEEFMLYAEGWIDFDYEIAVMVVRPAGSSSSRSVCYPTVNAIQQDSICRVVCAPARFISQEIQLQAQQLALAAIDSLPNSNNNSGSSSDGVSDGTTTNGSACCGIFGVEMFVTKTGAVLLNEIAPRPHNTGHYTQDACYVSQFENHLRAVCNLPLGSTQMKVPASIMINILGRSDMISTLASSNAALQMNNAIVHWYGKSECRPGRKMGHINLLGSSMQEMNGSVQTLFDLEGIDASILNGVMPANATSTTSSVSLLPTAPLVGVIMGSHSDLPTMQGAVDVLKEFQIPYEVDVVSAHRTPDKLMSYAQSASGRGISVIIAGAGGAAHLPGMVAAMTPLPVVGVPVKTSTLSGVDSLYSIVQMPKGVPVATVAIGNATNAGLLAVRILSTSRPDLLDKMMQYQNKMKDSVLEVSTKMQLLGSDEFLNQMENKNTSVNV